RHALRRRILSLPLNHIRAIHARRLHPNQNLPLVHHGLRPLRHRQHLRLTRLRNHDRFHASTQSPPPPTATATTHPRHSYKRPTTNRKPPPSPLCLHASVVK